MHPIGIFIVATAAVFLLIIRLRVHAFLALISASIIVGVLAPDIPLGNVVRQVGEDFGNIAGRIGIAIAAAAVVGQCLMESGAADKITRYFSALLGERYSSLALVLSGYLLAIPVFGDTVFYLLIPLARAMSVRRGGVNCALYVTAIAAGTTTHYFVPPTPGPLAMALTLNVDLGTVIVVGLSVACFASVCGWLYCLYIDRKLNLAFREAVGPQFGELATIAARPESELPSFWISVMPIILPVALITTNTVVNTFAGGSPLAGIAAFLGDPNFALLLSAAVSLSVVTRHKRLSSGALAKSVETAISRGGPIILITAGGGAFGGMLARAGVGDVLRQFAENSSVSILWLGFSLSSLLKLAQGSGTVSMITVSSVLAPLLKDAPPPFHAVYLLTAISAGSLIGTWMNDSGFWLFRTMTGLTEMETLKTKSAVQVVLGVAAFFVTLLGSRLAPLQATPPR